MSAERDWQLLVLRYEHAFGDLEQAAQAHPAVLPRPDGWGARAVLAHIVGWNERIAEEAPSGRFAPSGLSQEEIDRRNDEFARTLGGLPWPELLGRLRRAHAARLAAAEALGPGDPLARELLERAIRHYEAHAGELRGR